MIIIPITISKQRGAFQQGASRVVLAGSKALISQASQHVRGN
jgi:hypothetical protein